MPRRDPFREIEELFDRMSDEFEGISGIETTIGEGINVDVAEDDEAVTVTADLPGFDRDDVDVTVKDNVLTVSAEYAEETEEEAEKKYHRKERRRRSVSRRVRLPTAVEEEDASATFQNGVLTVTLPKVDPEATDGHSIDID